MNQDCSQQVILQIPPGMLADSHGNGTIYRKQIYSIIDKPVWRVRELCATVPKISHNKYGLLHAKWEHFSSAQKLYCDDK